MCLFLFYLPLICAVRQAPPLICVGCLLRHQVLNIPTKALEFCIQAFRLVGNHTGGDLAVLRQLEVDVVELRFGLEFFGRFVDEAVFADCQLGDQCSDFGAGPGEANGQEEILQVANVYVVGQVPRHVLRPPLVVGQLCLCLVARQLRRLHPLLAQLGLVVLNRQIVRSTYTMDKASRAATHLCLGELVQLDLEAVSLPLRAQALLALLFQAHLFVGQVRHALDQQVGGLVQLLLV